MRTSRRSSMINPSRISIFRFARSASAGSWVTNKTPHPFSSFRLRNRLKIISPVSVSRLPVGSSASNHFGSWTKARATATRCCCPPDNWDGSEPALSASPTFSRSDSARSFLSYVTFRPNKGAMTFSSAVKVGIR